MKINPKGITTQVYTSVPKDMLRDPVCPKLKHLRPVAKANPGRIPDA